MPRLTAAFLMFATQTRQSLVGQLFQNAAIPQSAKPLQLNTNSRNHKAVIRFGLSLM
jgi:hypothetical protein